MTRDDKNDTFDFIKKHEGAVKNDNGVHVIYDDATGLPVDWDALRASGAIKGYMTIGYGRNLEEGLTEKEANDFLASDLDWVEGGLLSIFGDDFIQITKNRQDALRSMMFNLGYPRFKKFQKTIAAIDDGNWDEAAKNALDSLWAKQVPLRAKEIAETFRKG